MILVVGGTGLVGSEICLKLAQRKMPVRALVRTTSDEKKVAALRSAGVELCIGDLKHPETLTAACNGASAITSTATGIRLNPSMGQDNLILYRPRARPTSIGSFSSHFASPKE